MANRPLYYQPEYWARAALMWLKARKGMYSRVYRVFEQERQAFGLGDTINIRKPATFTSQAAPGSSAQDIKTGTAQVKIDIFREVKIKVPDLDSTFAGQRFVSEHIGPMVDAIAQDFDERLYALAAHVPHTYDFANATDVGKKFAAMRRIMVENKVPSGAEIEYMAAPLTMERAGGALEFSQAQGAGDAAIGVQTTGVVAKKYGFNFFESQNGPTIEGDAILAPAGTLTVSGTPEKNTAVITLNTTSAQAVQLHKGQVIAIRDTTTGLTEKYAITADTSASGNNWPNVPISPPLRRDLGASSTWALVTTVGLVGSVPTYIGDLAFHRNAFAAVMVELPRHTNQGADMYVASDPDTGLSLRARFFYDGHNADQYVVIDALGGIAVLDADLALRPCVH